MLAHWWKSVCRVLTFWAQLFQPVFDCRPFPFFLLKTSNSFTTPDFFYFSLSECLIHFRFNLLCVCVWLCVHTTSQPTSQPSFIMSFYQTWTWALPFLSVDLNFWIWHRDAPVIVGRSLLGLQLIGTTFVLKTSLFCQSRKHFEGRPYFDNLELSKASEKKPRKCTVNLILI